MIPHRRILPSPLARRALAPSLAVLALLAAAPAAADHVLEIDRSIELLRGDDEHAAPDEHTVERGVLYMDTARVRFDQGTAVSWILDTAASKLYLVRHDLRVYYVFDVPVVIERYATTELERTMLDQRSGEATTEIEVTETGEKRQIDGYPARRVTVLAQSAAGGARFEYELWLSDEVPGGGDLYRAILREFGAVDVVLRPLARRLAELPGFPVLRRSVTTFETGLRSVDERRLVSVEERPLPASIYEPPASYLEQPFSVTEWLTPR